MWCGRLTDVEDADLGKAAEAFPLFANVLFVADDDDVLEFVLVEVAGSERHDEVAQADQRRVSVGEQTDDHVVAQHRHRRLLARLQRQVPPHSSSSQQCPVNRPVTPISGFYAGESRTKNHPRKMGVYGQCPQNMNSFAHLMVNVAFSLAHILKSHRLHAVHRCGLFYRCRT